MHSISLLIAAGLLAQGPGPRSDILPLKRLRLYETGVGYFERDGNVSGRKQTSLPLPASHLDDALKTMVVLSNGRHVEVGGIEFASSVSEGMARAIAGLPQDEDAGLQYHDLLSSLEGVDVELENGRERVRGTLIEVLGPFLQNDDSGSRPRAGDSQESEPEAKPEYPTEPEYTLVLRTDRGELRRMRTSQLSSVRPTEASANARIEVALAALSSRSPQTQHPLEVQISGSGPLKLGYIAETPVWRTTYRVVLDDPGRAATLQAWALIHNDTDEDWRDVAIELVNGRPTSFLFPLAAPRYARRELAEPEVALSTVPQLLNSSADRLWGDFVEVGGLGMSGTGQGGGGSGSGYASGLGSVGTISHGSGDGGASGPMLGDLAEFAQATGEESGALFVYQLPSAIDLAAHHSALVPVVQQQIDAESITWFDASSEDALMAARLVNSTPQTLPAGTVAFFDQSGFLGESGFDRLKPGEQSFAVHGVDLDVDLSREKRLVDEQLHDVDFGEAGLVQRLVVRSQLDLEVRNRSGRDRRVYVGLPVARNATLTGHDQLDYDHARGLPLADFRVGAGKTVTKTLRAEETSSRSTSFEELTAARLSEISASNKLSVSKREIVKAAAELCRELEAGRAGRAERMNRSTQLEAGLERLREDLRALGSAALKDRSARNISQRVVSHEDELERLRNANETAQRDEDRLVGALRKQLAKL